MNFVGSAIKLNNIKTYNSTSNTANDVFKKKFYSDYEEVDYNNYKDIDYNNGIDIQKQIEKHKNDKEWYEYIGDAVGFAKDVGVTWYASVKCGVWELVEIAADGLIMDMAFRASTIVSIWNKNLAQEIKDVASKSVAYDWTEKLYSEMVTILGVDKDIAYGWLHVAGNFLGTTEAYITVSLIPIPGFSVLVGGVTAMGSSSEVALNSGATFDEAYSVGTIAGILGTMTAGILNKIHGAAAGAKTLTQVAGHTLRGAGVAMIEPAVNTTTQYLVYGQDIVDENGNKIYNGVDGYLDYYKDSGGLLNTAIAGVVGGSSTAFKGYKGYRANYNKWQKLYSKSTDKFVNGTESHKLSESARQRNKQISKSPEYKELVESISQKGLELDEYGTQKKVNEKITLASQAESDKLAVEKVNEAKVSEPKITERMKSLENGTRKLTGLEYRLKSKDSMSRKILSDAFDGNSPKTLVQAKNEIWDSIRYTMICDEKTMAHDIEDCIKNLQKENYTLVKFSNTFDSETYKGINTGFISPDGAKFEVQFHTDQSFSVKQETNHIFYEIARNKTFSSENEQKLANKIMSKASSEIHIPDEVKALSKSYFVK